MTVSIVDTQCTLPRGTYDQIRTEARRLLERWNTPRGGFIASDYNDAEAIGVTFDRRVLMFEAFAEAGGYPDYAEIAERARAAGEAQLGHSWSRQTVKPEA